MTTVTLKIDDRTKKGKQFLSFVQTFLTENTDVIQVLERSATKPRYNEETEKAIKEVRAGKATPLTLSEFKKELYP